MSGHSKMEWTDATWNPVTGCTKTSPGCKFCYAERITQQQGEDFLKIVLHPDRLDQPLRWRKPRHIFVCSMGDLFHEKVPDEFIDKVWNIMLDARQHIFQVLTKRARRMSEWVRTWTIAAADTKPYRHIWCGVSCETQTYADERIPWLLKMPAAVRFVSVEPLLGPVDQLPWLSCRYHPTQPASCVCGMRLDWIIVGGESGGPPERALVKKSPRGFKRQLGTSGEFEFIPKLPGLPGYDWKPKLQALEWARAIRRQCTVASIPFFFKGWGGPTPKTGGRLLDGRTWDEAPVTNSAYLFQRATRQSSRDNR